MEKSKDILKNTCFFAAEYNPFHLGHQYHLNETRSASGAKYLVAVMSGNFVQRGEAAVLDKWQRAEIALRQGADAVLELPFAYALQSAENFAFAPVALANAFGAGYYSFGCEQTLSACSAVAEACENRNAAISAALKAGYSLPRALAETVSFEGDAPTANTVLGGMYLLWMQRLHCTAQPVCIRRTAELPTASTLRRALAEGIPSAELSLPAGSAAALKNGSLVDEDRLGLLMLNALRTHTISDAALASRVSKYAPICTSYEELLNQVKSKNFTMARLKRACVRTLCGLDADGLELINTQRPLHALLLGFRKEAAPLVSALSECASVPFITRPAAYEPADEAAKLLWNCDLLSSDIRMLCDTRPELRTAGQDYTRRMPVVGS